MRSLTISLLILALSAGAAQAAPATPSQGLSAAFGNTVKAQIGRAHV